MRVADRVERKKDIRLITRDLVEAQQQLAIDAINLNLSVSLISKDNLLSLSQRVQSSREKLQKFLYTKIRYD